MMLQNVRKIKGAVDKNGLNDVTCEQGFKLVQYFQIPMAILLTVLQCCMSPWSTLRPSMTMRPAIMAFVVAIAGMMLPAIAEKKSRRY